MRTRESAIEREFVHQADRLGIVVLATQVKLPIGRLDVLGRWHGLLAVFEVKSEPAGGEAISQAISYAEQVSRVIGMEDSGGVFAIIVAPGLKKEGLRAWRVGICEFIQVCDSPVGLCFKNTRRDPLDEPGWSPGEVLANLMQKHEEASAREVALMLSIPNARSTEDGGARVPSDCLKDIEHRGSVLAWARSA